ncbi:MAG: NAD-dependent epimerase/dehydratase family protein [Bacilli bacterium]|nr:NAD-dependent epimerase/dehydratase family protein [Bacilli bacterium]MDD3304947.1 NAD-dependent epimerase/dehydratase family protein [Bacilli bacterium]MDD4054059.1 NAD-dependent epimerase/dehydratase family protein [Bacilli bacterium]MDD4411420.1 NAD-dependent epimerase/dehydratase family protein [Bacilli bacterium]
MKVLVTGAAGFIGKNLCQHLKELNDMEIITFDRKDDFSVIENNITSIDFIFHLAGVNRPENVEDFYKGNTDLTKSIVDLLKVNNLNTPILVTSSIQAVKDNDYGKSKKQAEDILIEYGVKGKAYIYRLHNVFGKWCRPNYNSVTATFCHNVAHNLDITVNDSNVELELVYIDDVVAEFVSVLNGNEPIKREGNYCYVQPSYKVKLGDLADMIRGFKYNMESIWVPKTGDEFTKKLFSTYLSYTELDDLVFTPVMNVDHRGSFTELIKTAEYGQVSVSISKPGVFRGNHYHHTKMEKFIVVQGTALITFEHIITGEQKEYLVDKKKLQIVNIPVGYTHKIENVGDGEMVLLIWCNEIFDKDKPDTYAMEVKKKCLK